MTTILRYELWDFDSGNQVAVFESKSEALAVVREIYELDGPEAVGALGLSAIQADPSGKAALVPVLDSEQLLALVAGESAAPSKRRLA